MTTTNTNAETANNAGHWFIRQEKLDAYGQFAYYCNCGYKAYNREAIDGHVEWKKLELSRLSTDSQTIEEAYDNN